MNPSMLKPVTEIEGITFDFDYQNGWYAPVDFLTAKVQVNLWKVRSEVPFSINFKSVAALRTLPIQHHWHYKLYVKDECGHSFVAAPGKS